MVDRYGDFRAASDAEHMALADDGMWVKYEDYAALHSEKEGLEKGVIAMGCVTDKLRAEIAGHEEAEDSLQKEIKRLDSENASLRSKLDDAIDMIP